MSEGVVERQNTSSKWLVHWMHATLTELECQVHELHSIRRISVRTGAQDAQHGHSIVQKMAGALDARHTHSRVQ